MRRLAKLVSAAAACLAAGLLATPSARAADTTPPAPVTSVNASDIAKTNLTLHWTNPADADYAGVTIRRAVGNTAPLDRSSGLPVADVAAPNATYTDNGLAPGVTYSYALFAHDATPNYAAPATFTTSTTALTFTTSTPAPYRGNPTATSCHLTIFCMLVDDSGQWQRFNGSTWTAPAQLFNPVNQGGGFTGVSCPALAFCMAVTATGDAYIWNGSTWSAPSHVTSFLASVSCPAANACWAVAGHYAYKFVAGTWTKQLAAGIAGAGLGSISCATTTTCVTTGNRNGAGAYVWRWVAGGPWSSPTLLFHLGGDAVWSVSCAAAKTCMAVGDNSLYSRFDGHSWTTDYASDTHGPELRKVSCPTTTFCTAVGYGLGFTALQWNGVQWSAPTVLTPNKDGSAIACSSASLCLAANSFGQVYRWSGTRWSLPSTVDHTSGDLSDVACPLKTSCAALDVYGNVYGFDGQTWGAPRAVGGNILTCPSTSFCETYDSSDGRVRQHVGTSWPVVATLSPAPNYFACAGPTFCLGIAEGTIPPTTVKKSGSTWVYEPKEPLTDVVGLSCPSTFWCMAMDLNGHTATYDRGHSRWTLGPNVSSQPNSQPQRLSCYSPTFCIAVLAFSMARYDGHTWTPIFYDATNAATACVSTDTCVIANGTGYVMYSFGSVSSGAPFDQAPTIYAMSCQDAVQPFCVGVGFANAVVGN